MWIFLALEWKKPQICDQNLCDLFFKQILKIKWEVSIYLIDFKVLQGFIELSYNSPLLSEISEILYSYLVYTMCVTYSYLELQLSIFYY